MENTDPSAIVGVFRDPAKADRAVDELKQAGFREDQIKSIVYILPPTEERLSEEKRIVVTVEADGRDQQAFGILFDNGANNADLPPGLALTDSAIVSAQPETVDLVPEPELEASFSSDSFFGQENKEDREQFGIMDNPNFPHG